MFNDLIVFNMEGKELDEITSNADSLINVLKNVSVSSIRDLVKQVQQYKYQADTYNYLSKQFIKQLSNMEH